MWGFLTVARGIGGERRSARVYSAKNRAWFEKQLAEPAIEATLGLSMLDQGGYPGDRPLRATVQRAFDAPDWLTLSFLLPESRLVQPELQRSLLSFPRSVAERVSPSFGQCDYDDGLSKTAVERTRVISDDVVARAVIWAQAAHLNHDDDLIRTALTTESTFAEDQFLALLAGFPRKYEGAGDHRGHQVSGTWPVLRRASGLSIILNFLKEDVVSGVTSASIR